jgi:hypothetical protein
MTRAPASAFSEIRWSTTFAQLTRSAPSRLGSCDDCGLAPFGDDTSTSRKTAFAKIRARVEGTQLAAAKPGL